MYRKLSIVLYLVMIANVLKYLEYFRRDFDYASVDDDLNHDIHSLAEKYGYPFESHTVTTEDGYILTLHRILPKDTRNSTHRRAVFIQHGIFVSSIVWLLEGPSRALAYKLSDHGFDVWLGNTRGNTYSKRHVDVDHHLNPAAYYNYSFHEIGVFDLSASLDYVLNVTREEKIDYVGHSQGCVAFFVLMSERGEYQRKIGRMIAMAPGVFTQDAWAPSLVLGRIFHRQIQWFWNLADFNEIFSENNFGGKYATSWICADSAILQIFCRMTLYMIGGYNPQQLNTTLLPLFFTHAPAGGSTKQVLHFMQLSQAAIFRQFDYGTNGNLIKYNQKTPLEYNLSKISVPIDIFYSENDFYSSEKDTLKLASALGNVHSIEEITDKHFTHLNFMMSKNIYEVLNKKVINILSQHSSQ